MPLLGNGDHRESNRNERPSDLKDDPSRASLGRKQSQHSVIAKTAIMSHFSTPSTEGARTPEEKEEVNQNRPRATTYPVGSLGAPQNGTKQGGPPGSALTDTPATTAPNSPIM